MTLKIYGKLPHTPIPEEVEYKNFTFSAGEEQVRVGNISHYSEISIETNITNSRELVEFVMVLNAIYTANRYAHVTAYLPYLPYSRQDRVCYPGEAFGVSQFANMVLSATFNSSKFSIVTWDVHSNESIYAFKHNLHNIGVDVFINKFKASNSFAYEPGELVIVAPDKGAVARANLAAKTLGVTDVVYGKKVRNPENGEILGLLLNRELPDGTVSSDIKDLAVEGKRVLIVDDICDGGRTFIELAKSLKSYHVSTIDLYVTHGIFSRGFRAFEDNLGQSLINRFFVPNVFPGVIPPPDDFAILYTLP